MNKIISLFFGFSVLCLSCLSPLETKFYADYIDDLNKFDKELTKDFPRKLSNSKIIGYTCSSPIMFQYDNREANRCGLYVRTRCNNTKEFNEIKDKFSAKALFLCDLMDSCLVYIQNPNYLLDSSTAYLNCQKIRPVADDVGYEYIDSLDRFVPRKDIEVIILNTKSGNFIERDSIYPMKYMPKGWGNGYSTGIALIEKKLEIEYWLVIW